MVAEPSPATAALTRACSRLFRALGDPTRVHLLELLLSSPLTVSELVEATGMAQARVSAHLACLRWCRLVNTKRTGRQVIYQVSDRRIGPLITQARTVAGDHQEHLATCRRIGPDWI